MEKKKRTQAETTKATAKEARDKARKAMEGLLRETGRARQDRRKEEAEKEYTANARAPGARARKRKQRKQEDPTR